ncbi:conserved hypothetical protein [Ricinus communis]|uniref:Uncharacterized protein n=1 Tax=Ricinus communis TaxID=3988 RepID=B9S0B3_RICCO|nr:conserved hypothetical protein [Ricinus communis]
MGGGQEAMDKIIENWKRKWPHKTIIHVLKSPPLSLVRTNASIPRNQVQQH